MNFKRKANKLLALLLSLSLAMSTNMPISVLANEAEAPEKESSAAEIAYAMSGEEVIGINLNGNSVIIEEAKDVSGNSIDGKIQMILDVDMDGEKDPDENKVSIEGTSEFDEGLHIYGTYYNEIDHGISITVNSGTVGTIYGSYSGAVTSAGYNVKIYMNGGSAERIYGIYSWGATLTGGVYIAVGENAELAYAPEATSGDTACGGPIYINYKGALQLGGGYKLEEDLTVSSLKIPRGMLEIPEGITLTVESLYTGDYSRNCMMLLKGTLDAQSVTGYGKILMEEGTISGESAGDYIYYPVTVESNIENPPISFYSYYSVSIEKDGVKKYYLEADANVSTTVELQGFDAYYSVNDEEFKLVSGPSFYISTPESGETKLVLEYVPKQISVENKYSAPKGVVGQTYTAEKPLVDLSIYPIANDAPQEYGEVKYTVKKATPLPAGLSLVKGKIVGTPTTACADGQNVTVVVTGRNGSTADFTLKIKILESATTKGINETVFVDDTNKIMDLRGTSIVVLDDPDKYSSDYVNIYADADLDGLQDDDDALIINESSSINLYEYTLIGWQGIEDEEGNLVQAAYDGDIRITLKSGRVKKTYGVFGEGKKDIKVNGHVYLCLENGYGGIPVCGAYYGNAENVTVEVIGGAHNGGTIYGVDHATVTGDVNYTFGKMAYTTYNKVDSYLTQYVASASTINGNVNVSLGFAPDSTGLGQEAATNNPRFAQFYGVSATEVGGDVNYTLDGKFTPGTFNMVEKSGDVKSTVKGNLKIDWKSGNIGSPVLLSGSDVGGKVILDAEENAELSATYIYVCNDSSTADGIYVNIPSSCNGNVSNVNNTNGYKSSLFMNKKGAVTVGGTYEINENLTATSMTISSSAKVTIAEGVTVEGLSVIQPGATVLNKGTLKVAAATNSNGGIRGTLINEGELQTLMGSSSSYYVYIAGTIINRESGKWIVAGVLKNEGKIVNYGSFVQTCSIQDKYDKLGVVYTTMPLTLYKDPAGDKYALTGYSELYYAVNVSWPTHCASEPVLTGTVSSDVADDNNKYIRVYRNGNGSSPFSLTPGTVTDGNFLIDYVTYGPENTVADSATEQGVTTYSGNVVGMFEPITITVNYKATGNVTPITLEETSGEVNGLAVDKLYTYENPLYDLTKITILDDITAENGKVLYSLKEGALPDGIVLKDGKLCGKLTTTAEESTAVFTIKGLNQTTADFTLKFGEVAKAVPQWEVPAALTATVGQTLGEIELPTDAKGTYSWVEGTDTSAVFDEATTVEKEICFTPSDTANYDWTAVSGWDEENDIILFDIDIVVAPAELDNVVAPTGLTATYGQTFGEISIDPDENGTFVWDTEHHALTDFVGEVGEHTCYVTYVPTSKNYKTKSGMEVTLTVNAATPTYEETLTEVEVICDGTLGDALLPDAEGGKYQWVSATTIVPVEGESYQVIYMPEDTTNYDWTNVTGWNKMRKGVVFSVKVKLEHAWGEGKVTRPATEKEEGVKTYECGLCGATRMEAIPKLPNSGGNGGAGSVDPSTPPTDPSAPAEPPTPQPPKVGYTISDSSSNAVYKVSKQGKEVTFVKPNKKTYTKVTVPATVTYEGVKYKVTAIANNACKSNSKLKTVKIGSNVKSIGSKAFYGCKKLTKVTIGSKVTTIGNSAFQNCTALKSITIPKNVSKIGSKAFYGCKKLTKMTIKTTKLTEKKVGKNAFSKMGSSNYKKVVVKVPKKQKKAYTKWLKKRGLNKKAKIK